jgi:cytidylate kinase
MIIAIDGTAASGKGTLGRTLAMRLGLDHLDTGQLYRAVGLAVKQADMDLETASDEALKLLVESLDLSQNFGTRIAQLRNRRIGLKGGGDTANTRQLARKTA